MLDEFSRVYRNFDKCMACIEDIVTIAAKTNNIEIGKRVEQLLNDLEPSPISKLDQNKN